MLLYSTKSCLPQQKVCERIGCYQFLHCVISCVQYNDKEKAICFDKFQGEITNKVAYMGSNATIWHIW